jgi:hypothetical protein
MMKLSYIRQVEIICNQLSSAKIRLISHKSESVIGDVHSFQITRMEDMFYFVCFIDAFGRIKISPSFFLHREVPRVRPGMYIP